MATEVMLEPRVSRYRALEGKVALITGSSRGIGRAIARELADRGAAIAINYRSSLSSAEVLRSEIREAGGECEIYQNDISDRVQARALVREVLDSFHHLDVLVNNAGITRDRSIRKMTDED